MAETDPDIRARARLLAATAFACACSCAAPLEAQVRVTEILPRRSGASEPVVAAGAAAGRFAQFADGAIWLDSAGSVALALALAAALAFHPTHAHTGDAAEIDAERLAIVLSALVGAAIGMLAVVQPWLAVALVALVVVARIARRTSPAPDARALVAFIAAVACGAGLFVPAFVVALAGWIAYRALGGHRIARIKVRVPIGADVAKARLIACDTLARMRCPVRARRDGRSGRSFTLTVRVPVAVDDEILSKSLESTLAPEVARARVEIRPA
ncbi:MAG: hypothetical protein ACKO0W_06905 [Planctomycetota bacterium]